MGSKLYTVFFLFCDSYSFIPYVSFFSHTSSFIPYVTLFGNPSSFIPYAIKFVTFGYITSFKPFATFFINFRFYTICNTFMSPSKFYTIYIIFLGILHLLSTIYYLLSVTIYI